MRRFANQSGETLVEVLIAIVLIGLISAGYFYAASSQRQTTIINKEQITADTVARSYAELAKATVRNGCTPNLHFPVIDPSTGQPYVPPDLFSISTLDSMGTDTQICPASPTAAPQTVQITITTPNQAHAKLSFAVRTP